MWIVQAVLGAALLCGDTVATAPPPAPPCSNPGGRMVHRADGTTYPYFGWKCAGKGHDSDCGQCDLDHTCFCAQVNATTACCEPNGTPVPPPPPPSPPSPRPPPPDLPPYKGRCAVTAMQPNCTCGTQHPPFSAPAMPLQPYRDYHFPPEEAAEAAGLSVPILVSVSPDGLSATLKNGASGPTATLVVGGQKVWGWELLYATPANVRSTASEDSVGVKPSDTSETAVLEYDFAEWSQTVYLAVGLPAPTSAFRKPVGILSAISQPRYGPAQQAMDPEYFCKQDVDPTDWLARVARNISGGGEVTVEAAITMMAPNTDSGLLGNPEEQNKWLLTGEGVLAATPWGGKGPQGSGGNGVFNVWQLAQQPGCGLEHLGPGSSFDESKMGMVGDNLRVVNLGLYQADNASGSSCGVELMAVAPPWGPEMSTSTAFLRFTTTFVPNTTGVPKSNTTYIRAVVTANGTTIVSVDDLGHGGAGLFYEAMGQQLNRWSAFSAAGALASVPGSDRRYTATAASTLTLYMNLDQGFTPEYGGGQFWNTYNINLPLDTIAIGGALLAWGHATTALPYLGWFFGSRILNATGEIDYQNFGCDSDADYGRLIDLYATAVRYSNDLTWAAAYLPTIHAMATHVLQLREAAVAAFPPTSPLHGIVPGSPEHDICRDPGYFFSVNVWHVRGLLSLSKLHAAFPTLSRNATLEASLLPIALAWRKDINSAANFTAVRRSDGTGLFFLSPVVGSVYSLRTPSSPPLLPGGDESTCIARGTCFASMTAALPGGTGGSNQHTNYANFRIFSETLLAGVLDAEYELAIMNYRDSHRGTLLGMTRFRDLLDDMPILGYGTSALSYDRLDSFHTTLAGHTLNYLSRGTYWGTEQRQQLDYSVGNQTGIANGKWRNDCGVGGEYCSLCAVSSIPTAYWTRDMLVSADRDGAVIHIARGSPRRWSQQPEPFGITHAPTWLGTVSFALQYTPSRVNANISLQLYNDSNIGDGGALPLVTVRLASPKPGQPATNVGVTGNAKLVTFFPSNETAVFEVEASGDFTVTADF